MEWVFGVLLLLFCLFFVFVFAGGGRVQVGRVEIVFVVCSGWQRVTILCDGLCVLDGLFVSDGLYVFDGLFVSEGLYVFD